MRGRGKDRFIEHVFPIAGEFLLGDDAGRDRALPPAEAADHHSLADRSIGGPADFERGLITQQMQSYSDLLERIDGADRLSRKRIERMKEGLEEDLGRPKDAAATLDRLNFIYPEDEDLHRQLGGLWLAQGNAAGAVREYTAVLALKPLDMASAEFDVAKAYLAAGDKAKAEDSVLASLEVAPGYQPAQRLLLEIEGSKGGP